ncbi:MAG: hypothetical protein ABI923_13490 [bacterium]
MKVRKVLIFAIVTCIGLATVCLPVLGVNRAIYAAQVKKREASAPPEKSAQVGVVVDQEFTAYRHQVLERFRKQDYSWIDREAGKLRVSKERLPGGYWKLKALYDAIYTPAGEQASDGDWQDQITKLEGWVQQRPQSITPRVALAEAWWSYAWKARGTGKAETVSDVAWEVFNKRLSIAAQVLYEAATLKEKCPEWYVTSLRVGLSQSWDREVFERLFAEAVKLEPTYYYLYQAKAIYLLPRWFGMEGEWERFAEESALRVGGHEGDIIFFAIYSGMLSIHDITFMNSHQLAWPRLKAGFRSIEKLYGMAPHRLNQACYFAVSSGDKKTAVELFDRIGEEFDKTVWRSKTNFDMFRGTLNGVKMDPHKQQDSAQ